MAVADVGSGLYDHLLDALAVIRRVVAIVELVHDLDGRKVRDAWDEFEVNVSAAWHRFWAEVMGPVSP
jgi:hypothetical protein